MFELNEAEVEVTNVNHRVERHGDKPKLCFDISVLVMCHNRVLDSFSDSLRPFLYRAPGVGEQPRLADDQEPDELIELRKLQLKPLAWDEDYPGYTATFGTGLGLSKPVVLEQAKLSKFTFDAQEGGSVAISFRISGFEPNDKGVKLQNLLVNDPVLTLVSPQPTQFPQPGDQVCDVLDGAERVLVTGCKFKESKSTHLTTTTVTLSDGRELKLDAVAYHPDESQVIDLIKFNHGFNAEFTPALRDELWPAQAA